MASKLQYTYRSAANMSDEMVEYIKAGVERSGSFPKFVDALVAASMAEDGFDVPAAGSAAPVAAKVDLTPLEEMIAGTRDKILDAIAEQAENAPAAESEPAQAQATPAPAAMPSGFREDLVALRRAVATDIIKAKEEEVEKLDEILSAIESMKAASASEPAAAAEPAKPASVVTEGFYEREGDFEEDDYEYARKGDEAIEKVTRAELQDLPFDDDDFAAGIGDLIGISYMDDVDRDMVDDAEDEDDEETGFEGLFNDEDDLEDDLDGEIEDEIEDDLAGEIEIEDEVETVRSIPSIAYAYDDEIDDETLSGAEVLLGMD